MLLIADVFKLFMQHMSYIEYYPILTSCKELYTWRHYMNFYIEDMDITMDWAASNGYLSIVKYLHKIGKSYTSVALDLSIRNKHPDIAIYIKNNNIIMQEN